MKAISRLTLLPLLITGGIMVCQKPVISAFGLFTQEVTQISQSQETEADRLYEKGIEALGQNQFEAAINFWEQALILYREDGNKKGEANTFNDVGLIYGLLHKYKKAISYHEQSLGIRKGVNDLKGQADSYNNLGIAYESLGQYEQAIDYLTQSLVIRKEISDFKGQATSYNNLGKAYGSLGQKEKALSYYKQSLQISKQIEYREGEVFSYGALGLVYMELGQYQQAINFYQKFSKTSKEFGYRKEEAYSYGRLGNVYEVLGQYQQAINYHEKSLTIRKEINDLKGQAYCYNDLGNVYGVLGQYQQAINYHEQSLAIRKEINDLKGQADSYNNLGLLYNTLGEYQQAIKYYYQSLAIKKEVADVQGQATSYGNLAVTYFLLGQDQNSIDYYQQALAIFKIFDDKKEEATASSNLGFTYLKIKQYPEAENYFLHAIKLYENNLRKDLKDPNKISIFETQVKTYNGLQDVYLSQKKTEKALEIAERSRSQALIDALSANFSEPLPPLSSQKIQAIAKQENATLVEYSIIDNSLYIWVISPDGKITFREETINPNQPIAETAEQTRVQASLDRSRGISQNPDIVNRVRGIQDSVRSPFSETPLPTTPQGRTLNPQLQETYKLLIAPIADLLPQDPNQKVIFIPHRELFEIPFAALQDKEGTYLIEKHTILTSPSIALLDLTRQNRQQKQPSNESLIVGYPEMPTQFERLQAIIPRQSIKNTLQEAQTIAKKYNTQAITGKEATETLIKQKMQNAKLIHLASHGLLNTIKYQEIVNLPDKLSKIPGAIALTPSDQDDGLLTASEIIDMKLNADLVVLSACETGRGDITGEGVNGLSRAFLRAGASNLVISLWKVPDDTTLDLMLEFYQQLETTPDKAIALRQAMLNTMKKHPEPRHWGGFTLTGAANPKN